MLYQGKSIEVELIDNKIVKLTFDIKDSGANVIGELMMSEFPDAVAAIDNCQEKVGVILTSNKDHFIFGADITEFLPHFQKSAEEVSEWISRMQSTLDKIEDLNVPTVTLINGFALGGGMEVCLTTDYRLIAPEAKIGLPETKLGIIPGWGGTVRLPRLCGADHAIEWITSGKQWSAEDALKIGAVDGIVAKDELFTAGVELISRCLEGGMKWQSRKEEKKSPLRLSDVEKAMTFSTSKAFVANLAGPHYPAPVKAIEVMEKAANMKREEALKVESEAFGILATTDVAECLVQVFLGDQYLKRLSKKATKGVDKINKAAVLGAGIMGGGIAYQSAYKGTPIIMKDINQKAIDLGLSEATKLLSKMVARKKIDETKLANTLNIIDPTLSYGDMKDVDLVVEAVVENIEVKKKVLAELEDQVEKDTILTSNTSTISITDLAKDLKRPENFCGMHFFNPVHRMPLVEVIRGEKTSEEAINKTVKYALQMGKTPIVVNDCPGFLVNRVLFPYFNGFALLIKDGVDYKRIDKVMEKFGWPMGPAYLLDVVGIDTGSHAAKIMADCFPDRMKLEDKSIINVMYEKKRLGQKNNLGFYKYELDRKGKPKKLEDEATAGIIDQVVKKQIEITDQEIVERMMLPMIFECARCLEEQIVSSPQEVDMGLLLGLGFPPFRAGALKYADTLGIQNLVELSQKYSDLGNMYQATEGVKKMASENKSFYQTK
ncbi:MAG: fatty acid oxidation complex subunit alpha FadB [Halobacteriovoraceae bacterium]|nr:fatty acid oxidation complex subunit alpha FadB [Halobacteriovoraceae bacterium]|tara:strand:- start:11512 stop:13665 length:2154 start_codon:yes stop_codon:yes gene_type:complete